MRKPILILFVLSVAAAGSILLAQNAPHKKILQQSIYLNSNMKIESPAFAHNEMIPAKYTCDGENINPQLSISGVPKEAKSLVLIVDDPDASKGLWVHWIAWNISSDTKEIPENSVPSGAREGMTDSGKPGWRGPCPSSGTHRYFFKLYALDAMLGVPIETDKIELEAAMINHILASTELIGFYQKQRK